MAADILEIIDNALSDCTSPDAMRWRPGGTEPARRPARQAPSGCLELCTRAYGATDGWSRQDSRIRWVMDLGWYKRLRGECAAAAGLQADPDTWVPDPGDMLFGIRIDVRDHGGEPHLETSALAPWLAIPVV